MKYAYHLLAKTGEEDWKDLLLHFPFVLPLRNLGLAYRLYKLNFGMSNFDTKDWAEVEAIQKMVAKDGLTESFFESGPQASGCLIYEILIDIFDAIEYILIHIKIWGSCDIGPKLVKFCWNSERPEFRCLFFYSDVCGLISLF